MQDLTFEKLQQSIIKSNFQAKNVADILRDKYRSPLNKLCLFSHLVKFQITTSRMYHSAALYPLSLL